MVEVENSSLEILVGDATERIRELHLSLLEIPSEPEFN
jgi:hypothetical protein